MAQGIALHIGLNRVDPNHYAGWDGELVACEADARDMNALATKAGYEATMLLTKDATAKNVTDAITAAADRLASGDAFLLTYSGHGGQVADKNREEADRRDETWVLYDRQLLDDELYALWGEFKPGVRIFMLSDSCHSGTIARRVVYEAIQSSAEVTRSARDFAELPDTTTPRVRVLPDDLREQVFKQHRALYSGIQKSHPKGDKVPIGASVILNSGCLDNQLPTLVGWRPEWALHGHLAQGLERRQVHRRLSPVPPPHPAPDAAVAEPQLLHRRRAQSRLRGADTVHHLTSPRAGARRPRTPE
jgi:metacaspase-1